MFTPVDFCKHFGIEIDPLGRIKIGKEELDMFGSDTRPYHDLYLNDIWRFHKRMPRGNFLGNFMDIEIDPERRFVPSGTTVMLFCLEGI